MTVWERSRYINQLLRVFGPQKPAWLRRKLGMPVTSAIDSILLACDECGFLLYEEDDGCVGAAWIRTGR